MKKMIKNISICLMAVVTLFSSFGCSCEKKLKIRYTASVEPENSLDTIDENTQVYLTSKVEKKFREPVGTTCYTKDHELVTDYNVYKCYSEDGKTQFERATPSYKEKMDLESKIMLSLNYKNSNDVLQSASDYIKLPNNENYSLIYTFTLRNTSENHRLYIAKSCLTEESIFGENTFREDLQEGKISFSISGLKEEGDYYYLDGYNHGAFEHLEYEEIVITIEVKNLTNKDLQDSRNKTLDIKFNLLVK